MEGFSLGKLLKGARSKLPAITVKGKLKKAEVKLKKQEAKYNTETVNGGPARSIEQRKIDIQKAKQFKLKSRVDLKIEEAKTKKMKRIADGKDTLKVDIRKDGNVSVNGKKSNFGEPNTKKGMSYKKKGIAGLVAILGIAATTKLIQDYINLKDETCVKSKDGKEVCVDYDDPILDTCIKQGREVLEDDSTCNKYKKLGNYLPENLEKCFQYINKDEKDDCYELDDTGKSVKIDNSKCAAYIKNITTKKQLDELINNRRSSDIDIKKCTEYGNFGEIYNKSDYIPRYCFVYSKSLGIPPNNSKTFQRKLKFSDKDNKCDVLGENGQLYSLNDEELKRCTKSIEMIVEPRNSKCDIFGEPGNPVTTRPKKKPSFWDFVGDKLSPKNAISGITDLIGGFFSALLGGNLASIIGCIICIIVIVMIFK